jgi:glycosyltransferase involved in cell wall biosynthesis
MESVQAQSYPNLVHVLLDNASTDATPDIIRSFENGSVPLQVVRNPETVPFTDNWERAVQITPPEAAYFRILAADDKIMPTGIEAMAAIASANPSIGVVGCGFQVMDTVQTSAWPDGVTVLPGREAVRRFFMGEGEIIGPHILFRRDVLKMRTPFFDSRYNGIDTEVCLHALRRCDWGVTTGILGWTRVHEDSLSARVMHASGLHFSDWVRYIDAYGGWAMDEDDRTRHERAFLRYYLRRLMRWRAQKNGAVTWRNHIAVLREVARAPKPLDFADAVADVVLKRIGLRDAVRAGYPLG